MPGRVLIACPRKNLVHQAADEVALWTGLPVGIEMGASFRSDGQPVVCGTVHSIALRLNLFDPRDFGAVIFDEAHHASKGNTTYRAIHGHFSQNPLCRFPGLTAFAKRSDDAALSFFSEVAYPTPDEPFGTLEAIQQGYLVPPKQQFVKVDGLDFSKVSEVKGDLSAKQLDELIMSDGGRHLHEIAAAAAQVRAGRPMLVFTPRVASAVAIAKILSNEMIACCVHGKMPEDEIAVIVKGFKSGRVDAIVSCDWALEGFNVPSATVLVNAKPTKWVGRYIQMVGRVLRLLSHSIIAGCKTAEERRAAIAASAKPAAHIVDLTGDCGRHKIVSCIDALLGDRGEEVAERAAGRLKKSQESEDVLDLLDGVTKEVQAEKKEAERQKFADQTPAADLPGLLDALVSALPPGDPILTAVDVDLFDQARKVAAGVNKGADSAGITPAMSTYIRSQGYDPSRMTLEAAKTLLGQLRANRAAAPPSDKQAAALGRWATAKTRAEASVLLDIKNSQGRLRAPPPSLRQSNWSIVQDEGLYKAAVIDPAARGGKVVLPKGFPTQAQVREFYAAAVAKES